METMISADLFTLLLSALAVILAIWYWFRCRGLPPGPMGLPIVGFYPFLDDKDIYGQFHKFRKKYGDIFSFRTLGGELVVFSNGDAIKEMFVNRAEEILGRARPLNVLNYFDDGLGVAQSEGNDWKEKRKFFLAAVRTFGFGKTEHEEHIQHLIQDMIDDIRQEGNSSFHIRQKLIYVTGNSIAKIMCNIKYDKDDPEFLDMIKGFDQIVGGGLGTLFLVGLFFRLFLKFTPTGRKRTKEVNRLRKVIDKIIENHVTTLDPNNERDFIDAYLNQMKSVDKKGQQSSFSMASLHSITLNMLMEGTESTGTAISCFLLKLVDFSDVQKRIQQELDEVVGQSRLPAWTDRHNTPYLEATIQELYRVALFLYFTLFYSNFEEVNIRGYRIPKRSLISANFWSINNDPEFFPNPSKFDPERYLGPDGKRKKLAQNPIAFGVGKRACVGESLAQMEIYLIIAAILQNFTLYPGEDGLQVRAEPREKH